ncbi:hypothetical protein BH09VER1_BH09VER1_42250 [soil metagenome]
MSEAARFVARHAVAIAAATLVMAIFRLPQPFLAVLAAFLMLARPFWAEEIPARLGAAWVGVGLGLLLVCLFPQQPWLLFPAFCVVTIISIRLAARTGSSAVALLVAMGLCASLPAGLISPHAALEACWAHGWNLSIGVVVAWASFALFPSAPVLGAPAFSAQNALYVALTVVVASWVALVLQPISSVILVIAAATSALGMSQPGVPARFGQKTLGACLGGALSVVLDVTVAGSGNSIAIFLAAMGLFAGGMAWCMRRWSGAASCFTQCCAMFVVAAPMLPGPDTTLAAMGGRVAAVLAGFFTAAGVYGLMAFVSAPRSMETAAKA